VDSASAQTAQTNGSNERTARSTVCWFPLKLKTAVEYWRALYVYTHKPFVRAIRSFIIAVVGSADGQTFLDQSPYVFYEGEKCKVVGTIHNSDDERIERTARKNGLCVYPIKTTVEY
jgi:hypothetical protein